MLDTLFTDIRAVDWTDLVAVTAASDKLLTTLDTHRDVLRRLADGALANPDLLRLCEHYDILNKIVLHDDPAGWRLRLHVFLPGYFDRPHNHRWSYTSRILAGSYTHTLYGTDEGIGDDIDPAALVPRMVRIEQPGDSYTLHHSMIHSVVARPYTASLVARGPAIKDRFIVTDRYTSQVWWQYGAANENSADSARKRMTVDQARDCIDRLAEEGIIK